MNTKKKTIEQLFQAYYAELHQQACQLLHDPEESKDAVSEVFAKLLQAVFQIVKDRSTINKKILSIIDRADEESSDYTFPFARCAYVAYTATPYSCILNERPDQTEMYPDFIYSLEKSPKYFGLDEIFGRDVDSAIPKMDIV